MSKPKFKCGIPCDCKDAIRIDGKNRNTEERGENRRNRGTREGEGGKQEDREDRGKKRRNRGTHTREGCIDGKNPRRSGRIEKRQEKTDAIKIGKHRRQMENRKQMYRWKRYGNMQTEGRNRER